MKSGIVTRSDPFLMDPSLMVDPNLILDYGPSFKGTSLDDSFDHIYVLPSYNDLTGRSFLDEVQCNLNSACTDSWIDLINYNDSQLEEIILDSGLCSPADDSSLNLPKTEFDFEEFLKSLQVELKKEPEFAVEIKKESESSSIDYVFPNIFDVEPHVVSYEEVFSYEDAAKSPSVTTEDFELDSADLDSVRSFVTDSSSSTLKRKLDDDDDNYSSPESAPRRKRATRRTRRVQDERVKNQNKVAAMKYRRKKREEKVDMDQLLDIEEERNKKLKSEMEEVKVNIDVLKELLGKYLSPSQLKAK